MSYSLWPYGLQHARLPCPSPSSRVFSKSFSWVSDAIRPSNPLLPPSSPPAFNLSQHQGFVQWVCSLHQVAKVLELQLQHQSFQWIRRVDSFRINWFDLPAGQRTLRSLLQHHNSKASIEHQCSTFSHTHTWLLEKPTLWLYGPLSAMMSLLFNTLSRSA